MHTAHLLTVSLSIPCITVESLPPTQMQTPLDADPTRGRHCLPQTLFVGSKNHHVSIGS